MISLYIYVQIKVIGFLNSYGLFYFIRENRVKELFPDTYLRGAKILRKDLVKENLNLKESEFK
jgi:hypothetical protein